MSPCSASANRLREPESAWPMLLPSVESTAPSVIIAAPAAPMNSAEASASGVFDAASPGSVPSATTCASVEHDGDDDDRHDQRERHRPARILRLAGRHRNHFVAAEGEDQQQRAVRQRRPAAAAAPVCSAAMSIADRPTTMKSASGTSLPIVSTFTTHALWRMPRMLMTRERRDDRRQQQRPRRARRSPTASRTRATRPAR